jgi:hypothetical protein
MTMTMMDSLDWPLKNEATGKPATTGTNHAVLLAALEPAAVEQPEKVEGLRQQIQNCSGRRWRQGYVQIYQAFVEIQAQASPAVVKAMCKAGLEEAEKQFVFRSEDDSTVSLTEAFEKTYPPLSTLTYRGKQPVEEKRFQLASPHGTDDNPLWVAGRDAVAQLEAWENYGCMEPSAAAHAREVCLAEDASVYVQDTTFCLLGLTSEMGPVRSLLKLPGAHVLGVARGGTKLEKLVDWIEVNGATRAMLQVPEGGADLLGQAPAIAEWIVQTAPANRRLAISPLAYLDGEACTRVSVAMDKIVTTVMEKRKNVSLVYLTSPATCYTIPKEAALDAKKRYEERNLFSVSNVLAMASFGHLFRPANTWKQLEENPNSSVVFNGVYSLQGPNYCLAKTMQQWRCILANSEGVRVCAPHAPGTRTVSVTHNEDFAAALEGMQYFPPHLAFDVKPCSSLLAAIILSQLHQKESPKLNHPLELFFDGSVHGGSWRCPYAAESLGVCAYAMGKLDPSRWCPADALAPKPEPPAERNTS